MQALLFTSSDAVLLSTLLLLLRPSQQYSTRTPFELSSNTITKSRLLRLAEGGLGRFWARAKEGNDSVDLAKLTKLASGLNQDKDLQLPVEWFGFNHQFYKPSSGRLERLSATTTASENDLRSASELERPTQELRLQSGVATPARASTYQTPLNLAVDSPRMETPSRSSGLPQSSEGPDARNGLIHTSEPSIAFKANTSVPSPASHSLSTKAQLSPIQVTMSPISRMTVTSDGLVNIQFFSSSLLNEFHSGKRPTDLLHMLVECHPELKEDGLKEELFELSSRIRVLWNLRSIPDGQLDALEERRKDLERSLEIRMIAMGTWLHLTTENSAQNALFLYNPHLISSLAPLTAPQAEVSDRILASVYIVLEAMSKYKGKVAEVLTNVGANVPHGSLLKGFDKLVQRLIGDGEVLHELVDAQLAFVAFASTNSGYTGMLVSAGILSLLIEAFKIRMPKRSGVSNTFCFTAWFSRSLMNEIFSMWQGP